MLHLRRPGYAPSTRPRRVLALAPAVVLALVVALLTAACGENPPGGGAERMGWLPAGLSREATAKATAAFNRGVSHMEQYEAKAAIADFEEALAVAPSWTTARFNLGVACLNAEMEDLYPRAEQELLRVAAEAPEDPRPHFALGMLWQHLGRLPEAVTRFERVLELDPADADAQFRIALLVRDEDPARARRYLEATLARIPHHEAATYHLFTLLRDAGEEQRAAAMLERFQALKGAKAGQLSDVKYGEMGRHADVVRAFQRTRPEGPGAAPGADGAVHATDVTERLGLSGVEGADPGVAAADVDGDGDTDLLFAGTKGVLRLIEDRYAPDGGPGVDATKATSAWFGDMDGDGDPDLALLGESGAILRNDAGTFTPAFPLGADVGLAAAWFDADHDGDLDLFAGNLGVDRLWRNDGSGAFVDVAGPGGIAGPDEPTVAAVPFDLDDDTDLDLYVLHEGAASRVWRNDRVGAWTDVSADHPALADDGRATGAALGDVDGDGREDLLIARGDAPPRLVLQRERGRYTEDAAFAGLAGEMGGAHAAVLADIDLDGDLDVVLLSTGGKAPYAHRALQNRGDGRFRTHGVFGGPAKDPVRGVVATDLDGDGTLEIVATTRRGRPEVWRLTPPANRHWLEVALDPTRSKEGARPVPDSVGLMVEVKTGQRLATARAVSTSGFLGSQPPVARVGLGLAGKADYVRLVWPDGMLQSEMEVAADQRWRVPKVERKPSSCPVLFAWDGTQFAFVTDFLGVGGAGFFLKPGVYAPPDPTEDVRIPPELLRPKDGQYLLRIAEPLEEVTWLDQAHLIAYDHPASWEVYPDERFTGSEPWPTGRPIAVAEKVFPRAARDEQGRDVLARVLAVDRRYVEVPLEPRFVGFAKDHWLEVDFGDRARALPDGATVILFLHGWVEYTYSHVNFAALQAGLEMRSPWIEVPDGQGGWKVAMAECGYPAGLPRMMTVDVTSLPLRADGRLRIRSNMQVYWDQVFLGEDVSGVATSGTGLVTHVLRASAAHLRSLGYPREYSPDGRDPTCYDYRRIDPGLPFRAMSGDFTRFGDVRDLLDAVDERCVVMARGEEIALAFDASALPPLAEGRARTLVLHADGWCKDMDLLTAFPDTVEPTPYHGMQNYPPAQPLPDTEALREYRRNWNTRRIEGRAAAGPTR